MKYTVWHFAPITILAKAFNSVDCIPIVRWTKFRKEPVTKTYCTVDTPAPETGKGVLGKKKKMYTVCKGVIVCINNTHQIARKRVWLCLATCNFTCLTKKKKKTITLSKPGFINGCTGRSKWAAVMSSIANHRIDDFGATAFMTGINIFD